MNIPRLFTSLTGLKRAAPRPVYAPLLPRKTRTTEPVSLGGNKLIVGPPGSGRTFFSKYLLHKSYGKAKVLFLDASNNFGWYRDGFTPWFTTIHRFDVPGEKVNSVPSPMRQPEWDSNPNYILAEGLTVLNVLPNWEWEEKADFLLFIQNVLAQFASQPYSPDNPTILILDQCLHLFFMDRAAASPLSEMLIDLLKKARKFNRKIWLLHDGGFYGLVDQKGGIPRQRLQKVVANVNLCCMLQHSLRIHRESNFINSFYNFNKTDFDLLQSVNQNLDPSIPTYKEVFIVSAAKSAVYGIVAPADELDT